MRMFPWPLLQPISNDHLTTPTPTPPHPTPWQIIHRDLKAENVLLTRGSDGRTNAKLADFGLHKLIRRPGQAHLSFYHIK